MKTIYNWKARRAGGRITIVGKDEFGGDMKIVGVDYIEPRISDDVVAVAVDRNNQIFGLGAV